MPVMMTSSGERSRLRPVGLFFLVKLVSLRLEDLRVFILWILASRPPVPLQTAIANPDTLDGMMGERVKSRLSNRRSDL